MENIKNAFNKVAEYYDMQRRSLIPCFDDFYGTIQKLAISTDGNPEILDIGAGTVLVSEFLIKKFPLSKFTLIDLSDEMLSIAKLRFKEHSNFKYIIADYFKFQFTESYDIIVSGLSIHHLEDYEKKALYNKIYSLLSHGGIFINGDQFLSRSLNGEYNYQKAWKEKIENSDLSEDEKKGAYQRMLFDKPATVDNNLKWLEDAGFSDADIYYKYYNFGVISAVKK